MTVDEVFGTHSELLMALMDRRPASMEILRSIVHVLDVYAAEITELDQIIHQPHVTTYTITTMGE